MKAEFVQPYSKDRKPLHELLPLDTPLTMYIDPANMCNFSCQFCFHGDDASSEKMNKMIMEMSLFEKIVTDLKEFPSKVKMIHLHGFGEPLLNRNLAKMISLLKQEDVVDRVALTTNASAFNQKNIEDIISAGLDQIHVSIYGLSNDQYLDFTKTKVDFSRIVKNLEYLYKIKGNCHIHIKITGDYFDDNQKKYFLEIFGDLCDTIFIDNASNIWLDLDISKTLPNGVVEKHQYSESIVHNKVCPQLFYQVMVHSDGIVSPCCADFSQRSRIGDVNTQSLKSIWDSEYLKQMRMDHLTGKGYKYDGCNGCNYPVNGSSININPYLANLINIYE